MANHRKYPDPAETTAADPLWPLTVTLGDIARRVERRRAPEQSQDSPETRRAAGGDPAARREVG